MVVFRDRPAAQEHLLVVPLTHIGKVDSKFAAFEMRSLLFMKLRWGEGVIG